MAISKSEPRIPPAAPTLPVPKRIGRFDVIDRLATGGMAEIFICCERGMAGLERLVVVKRILPHLAVHAAFVEMFLAEARYVARLNHPNIVQIYELGEDGNAPYLAMEYVPGSSVRDVLIAAIERGVATPTGAGVGLVAQACAGAHLAHELTDVAGKPLGLVHRDISPHNLMATAEGHVKLLDFGIAKATEVAELDDHTRTGALKGKVHYMAPEQCKQDQLDRRADIFALGIVLWEVLAQERLFKRDSDLDSMQAIVSGDLKSLAKIRPDIPRGVVAAVEKALRPNKDERYATADEMRRALVDACNKANIRTDVDAVGAFVKPLLGDLHAKRTAELVSMANERTRATPAPPDGGDVTVVDKKTGGKLLSGQPVKRGTRSGTGGDKRLAQPSADATVRADAGAAPSGMNRRAALIGVGVVAALVLGGVIANAVFNAAPDGPPLKVAFAPLANREGMVTDLQPFAEYLQGKLHRPVEIVIPESYEALSAVLLTGEAHIAALPPFVYVKTTEQDPNIQPLAVKLSDGSNGSDGLIYVDEQSAIRTLQDLKGKRFCFTDTLSTTGYLLPRLALREAGLDPDRDLIAHLSGSHENVMRDLTSGVCDAGATYNGGYLAADRAGVPVARTRQLALTGRSPQDAMCAAAKMPAAEREQVRRALFEYKPKKREETRAERVSGFAPISDRDYDRVRAAHKQDVEAKAKLPR